MFCNLLGKSIYFYFNYTIYLNIRYLEQNKFKNIDITGLDKIFSKDLKLAATLL